jgi:outer membrane murein-binding lipoprotein Lpp
MTAEPSEPQPDWASFERRLAAVEHQQRHVLPHDLAATREALGVVHDIAQATSLEVGRNGQRLDQVAAEMSTVARSQIDHGAALAGLAGKVDGLERKVDGLERKVDGLDGKADRLAHKVDGLSGRVGGLEHKVDGLAGKVDAQGETLGQHGEALASHGEMLAEILRRLPAAGE